jgi:hypothetical protein
MVETADKILYPDEENPAFTYLQDIYSIDVSSFSDISDLINRAAKYSASKYALLAGYTPNDHLVHFFYDLFLTQNSKLYSENNDIASACTDGMHIRYFGQPSQKVIANILAALVEEEKCFLVSFFKILKQPDYLNKLVSFAHVCVSEKPLGASMGLSYAEYLFRIMEIVTPKLESGIKHKLK